MDWKSRLFILASINGTAQSSILANFSRTFSPHDTWILLNYTYQASATQTVVLNFTTVVDKHNDWMIDDVSVCELAGSELSINGNFHSLPMFFGWNSSGPSVSGCTTHWNSTAPCRTTTCYIHECHSVSGSVNSFAWLSQSFHVLHGVFYSITFWIRLETRSGGGDASLRLEIS